ncbi:MAG TPA: carbohydrate-binding protein, partial [Marinagarivorans sp.]
SDPAGSSAAAMSSSSQAVSSSSAVSSSLAPTSSSAASSMAPASGLTIQENTTGFCGAIGTLETEHTGFSGDGFIDTENQLGATIDWQINVAESNVYQVTVRYANGGETPRSGSLTANGNAGSAATITMATTDEWTNWREETIEIALNAGSNHLVLTATGPDGLANIDSITISGANTTAEQCANASSSEAATSSSSGANSSTGGEPTPGTGADDPKMPATQWVGYGPAPTGGAGGETITVSTGKALHDALCGRAGDTTPLTIKVNGTINHSNTDSASGSCNGTKADTIVLKEVENITIEGVGTAGVFDQIGIQISRASNIIIRNVHIKNVKKSGSPTSNGGDGIAIEGGPQTRIWIDHNTIEASGGESEGYDSLIDMKNDTTHVTVSYNHFRNSSRGGLIGANDSPDGNDQIVFHHNFYQNIEQRTPLLRRATIHSFNNYWENDSSVNQIHYINARAEGRALVQNNYFKNVNNPLIASTDSDVPGCWAASGNAWEGGTYTRTPENDRAHLVPVNWQSGDLNGDNCNVVSADNVTLDATGDVPAIVKKHAGVGKL